MCCFISLFQSIGWSPYSVPSRWSCHQPVSPVPRFINTKSPTVWTLRHDTSARSRSKLTLHPHQQCHRSPICPQDCQNHGKQQRVRWAVLAALGVAWRASSRARICRSCAVTAGPRAAGCGPTISRLFGTTVCIARLAIRPNASTISGRCLTTTRRRWSRSAGKAAEARSPTSVEASSHTIRSHQSPNTDRSTRPDLQPRNRANLINRSRSSGLRFKMRRAESGL